MCARTADVQESTITAEVPQAVRASSTRSLNRWAIIWNTIWSRRGVVAALIAVVRASLHALHRRVLLHHVTPNTRLLELGCGPATLSLSLAPLCTEVVGVDISEEALRQARAHQTRARISNAQFLLGDCRSVPFADTFDIVWSAGLIEHFFDRDIHVVREHLRATKPGGTALLSVPARFSLHHLHYLVTRPRILRRLWPWSDERNFQKFYARAALTALGQRTGYPFRVFYLPPAPVGALLGILVLEIAKPESGETRAPGSRSERTS